MPRGRKRVSENKRMDVADRDGWECRYCGVELDYDSLEIDHRRPVSKRGTNRRRNLQATCQRCNREKGNKTHKQYMRWLKKNDLLEDVDGGGLFGLGGWFN